MNKPKLSKAGADTNIDPFTLYPKGSGMVTLHPLSPKQILRNLENGYFMTHREQTEAAQYIRELQGVIQSLTEGMMRYAEEIVALRHDLNVAAKANDEK